MLFIALTASPLVGVLLSIVLVKFPWIAARFALPGRLPIAIGAGITLIAAWLLIGQVGWEVMLGNWLPLSFTGLPLAMRDFTPAASILIAWTTLYLLDNLLQLPDKSPLGNDLVAPALLIASLAIVGFANNAVALLVGLGLTDLIGAYRALRHPDNVRGLLIGLVLNGLSVALLTLIFATHAAAGNSLHFPLLRLDESAAPAMALAVALRLQLFPFRPSPAPWVRPHTAVGAVGGLLVLARLPTLGITRLPEWFYALALIGALLTLIIGILRAKEETDAHVSAIATAGAYLASISAILATPGATAAAAIAWLVGATLIGWPGSLSILAWGEGVRRIWQIGGALCLIGLPPTVGFIGQAGVAVALTERGVIGWLFLAGWSISIAMMTYALAKIIFNSTEERGDDLAHRRCLGLWIAREIIGGAVAVAPIVLFGIAPGLLGVGSLADALERNAIAGWVSGFVAIAVGVLLWRLEPYWRRATQPIGERVGNALSLDAFYDLFSGAIARLRHPFSQVFNLLESDGALLWTIIIVLLIVLISRPGGP